MEARKKSMIVFGNTNKSKMSHQNTKHKTQNTKHKTQHKTQMAEIYSEYFFFA